MLNVNKFILTSYILGFTYTGHIWCWFHARRIQVVSCHMESDKFYFQVQYWICLHWGDIGHRQVSLYYSHPFQPLTLCSPLLPHPQPRGSSGLFYLFTYLMSHCSIIPVYALMVPFHLIQCNQLPAGWWRWRSCSACPFLKEAAGCTWHLGVLAGNKAEVVLPGIRHTMC